MLITHNNNQVYHLLFKKLVDH